jgi:hypothetical protein
MRVGCLYSEYTMYLTHTEKHDDCPSSLGLSADTHVNFKEALDTIIHKK